MILKNQPDAVIVATGSEPVVPEIPGADRCQVVSAHDVLKNKMLLGEKVLIIGGGSVGCETADYLAGKGKTVTIAEMLDDIAIDTGMLVRALLLDRLNKQGIKILTKSKVVEILDDGVVIEKEGSSEKIDGVDVVVFAVGAKSNNALAEELKDEGKPVTVIGDCVKPKKILDAIWEGVREAYKL